MTASQDAPARLVLQLPSGARQQFTLSKPTVTIGRGMTSDIVLRDAMVSRAHARVERTPRGYQLVDQTSANGVRVNGVVQTSASLVDGDVLTLGESTLTFDTGRELPAQPLTRIDTERELETLMLELPAPVHLADSSVPRLAVHTSARTWEVTLHGDRLTIGRDARNDLVLEHDAVSRHHAVLERRGGVFTMRDLASRNGTWVGSQRVTTAVLSDGDTAVIGPASLTLKTGVSPETLEEAARVARGARRRPTVIVPGFAGSSLWLGDDRVWPTLRMRGLAEGLRIDVPLDARGIVDEVVVIPNLIRLDQYGLLSGYLKEELGYEAGRDLLEFAYDFRQDNRVSARQLAARIDAWNVQAPITIIAHSMGCLVARYYVERLGGRRKIERVILLGGPHAGAPYAFTSLLSGPNLLPLGMMNQMLRDVIACFPSWYQILPADPCVVHGACTLDVLTDDAWVTQAQRALLRDARCFHRELGRESSVPSVCVFGYGFNTITGVSVERDAAGAFTQADVVVTPAGDGTIPERCAILSRAEIHPVRQHHGSLYVDNDVQMRLRLELTRTA